VATVTSRTAVLRGVAGTVLVLALAGCGGHASVSGSGEALSDTASCNGVLTGGKAVTFGPPGASDLAGVLLGTGKTGLILAHQNNADHCQWAPYTLESVQAGYRVLSFDFPGFGRSPTGVSNDDTVVAATGYLRAQGVTSVALIGASMGGTAVLVAAPKITPPVAGVISLSAPATFRGADATAAVAHLGVPVLFAACEKDLPYGTDAATLYAATPAGVSRTLLVVPGCNRHGVALTDPNGGADAARVRAAMRDFLTAHAPA
jgi:pimeloyl-ACP methyl ester carboxylesterase